MSKSKNYPCRRCGIELHGAIAAHDCPHGMLCRFKLDASLLPIDWTTLECSNCDKLQPDEGRAGPSRGWVPTRAGWAVVQESCYIAEAQATLRHLRSG